VISLLITLLVVLLGLALAWWIIDYMPVPPPLNHWAKIIVIVIGAIFLIGILLNAGGVSVPGLR
jgi:hypothetical protein